MRVGLLSQWHDPEPGPGSIAPVLAHELIRRQHAVRVLTGFPNFPEGRLYDGYRMSWRRDGVVAGVPVRRVALVPSHSRSRAGRLANYGSFAISATLSGTSWFKDVEGVWVFNSPPSVGLPTWVIKVRYRPYVVMHVMDLWPESLHGSGFGGVVQKWSTLEDGLNKWLSMTYGVADAIACTSRTQIKLLVERGVPEDKLSYVPIWVDEDIFFPSDRDEGLAADLGIQDKTVLLYAGTLGDTQGLEILVDVCGRLRDEPDFHCVIAGTGIAESRLRSQAKDMLLTNISFLGRWPTSDMTRLMSIGAIHLVSLRSDPLAEIAMPSKVPATLASGKPLIVAALGDAAEIVARSGAGWACPPGDAQALEEAVRSALAAGSCRLQEMGQRGREQYELEFAAAIGAGRVEQLLAGPQIGGIDVS